MLLLVGTILVQIFIQIFIITLFLLIPLGLWMAYIAFRIQVYYQEFKPRVVGLVLDFIDNDINYGTFRYDAKGGIPKAKFLAGKKYLPWAGRLRGRRPDYRAGARNALRTVRIARS